MGTLPPSAALQEQETLIRRESRLCLLLSYMHLQEAGDHPLTGCTLLLYLQHQPFTVEAVDQRDDRGDLLHLVTLQPPDKMPLNIPRELLLLGHQFLHTAFA